MAKITRKDFFDRAVQILFEKRADNSNCSYRQSIELAEMEFGISHEQLRKLCSEGEIEIDVTKVGNNYHTRDRKAMC